MYLEKPLEFIVGSRTKIIETGTHLEIVEDETKRKFLATWDGSTGRVATLHIPGNPVEVQIFPYRRRIIKTQDTSAEEFFITESCCTCVSNERKGIVSASARCREHVYRTLSFDGDGGMDEDEHLQNFSSSFVCPRHSDKK